MVATATLIKSKKGSTGIVTVIPAHTTNTLHNKKNSPPCQGVMSFNSILISRPNASKARLPSLYADFRPLKHNNPEGYLANIHVWQSALSHALSQNTFQNDSILVLDITSQFLSDISFPPYGRPLGIASVVVLS